KLLDRRLQISRQEGGSRLVEVSYEGPDRVLAAQVVGRIVTEYVGYTTRTEATQDTATVAQLRREVDSTARKLGAAETALQALPAAAMRYGQLVRDRTVREATYLALQKQLKQTEVSDALRQERVRIVDAPRVANVEDRAFPNKPVMITLGAILGMALALTT